MHFEMKQINDEALVNLGFSHSILQDGEVIAVCPNGADASLLLKSLVREAQRVSRQKRRSHPRVKYAEIEPSSQEHADLEKAGARVHGAKGGPYEGQYAVTLGWAPRDYRGEKGASKCVAIMWPDNHITWPCLAAIVDDNGKWRIG